MKINSNSSSDPMRIKNILNPETKESKSNQNSDSTKIAQQVFNNNVTFSDLNKFVQKDLIKFAKGKHNCTDEQIAFVVNKKSRIEITPKQCRQFIDEINNQNN